MKPAFSRDHIGPSGVGSPEENVTQPKEMENAASQHDREHDDGSAGRADPESLGRAHQAGTYQAVVLRFDTKTDWKEGSPITHKGEWQGKTYEDKGKILKVTRPALQAVTHWSSMSGKPDRPENYERVTYELVDRGRSTDLTITEENLASEEAKAMSSKTWKGALDGLKKLVEK
jgi:Activator of Hsp90 ATPase homolog 1-like protein